MMVEERMCLHEAQDRMSPSLVRRGHTLQMQLPICRIQGIQKHDALMRSVKARTPFLLNHFLAEVSQEKPNFHRSSDVSSAVLWHRTRPFLEDMTDFGLTSETRAVVADRRKSSHAAC